MLDLEDVLRAIRAMTPEDRERVREELRKEEERDPLDSLDHVGVPLNPLWKPTLDV